jgi:YVTN family beta-propeller protein
MRKWLLALITSVSVACDNSSAPPIAAEITVTPADTAIERLTSLQLTVTVRDSSGNIIPDAPVQWQSLNPTIATVSNTGLVHSEGPAGVADIIAVIDSLGGVAEVLVLDSLLVARAKLPESSYAGAISGNVAYVGQTYVQSIRRADLPSRAFAQPVTVGDTPTEMAFNSTGSRLYVTNQYSSSISVINVGTNAVIDAIPVGNRPFEVIVEPGDSILWTGKIDSLYGIRLATKEIIARFLIGDVGNGVAIARDTLLYVSTHNTGTVVEINLRTRTQGRTFSVGGVPQKLVVSPSGNELYIANESGYIQFWNLVAGTQIGSNLMLPSAAYGLARRATNGLLYATSASFGGGYLYVIDPVARTLVHSSVVGGGTRHITFNANGSVGIVPNEGGWVDFIR